MLQYELLCQHDTAAQSLLLCQHDTAAQCQHDTGAEYPTHRKFECPHFTSIPHSPEPNQWNALSLHRVPLDKYISGSEVSFLHISSIAVVPRN